jgi:hypothetical protein
MYEKFRRRAARTEEEQLIDAGILDGSERTVEKELAVQAFKSTGGIPSRIVGSFGHGNEPLPDLTQTEEGRATLDRLDNFVRDRLQSLQNQGSSPDSTPK